MCARPFCSVAATRYRSRNTDKSNSILIRQVEKGARETGDNGATLQVSPEYGKTLDGGCGTCSRCRPALPDSLQCSCSEQAAATERTFHVYADMYFKTSISTDACIALLSIHNGVWLPPVDTAREGRNESFRAINNPPPSSLAIRERLSRSYKTKFSINAISW